MIETAWEAELDGWNDRDFFGDDVEPAEIAPGAELVDPELVEGYKTVKDAA